MPPGSFRAEAYAYKPPSMLAQYKGLAIVFAILFLALAAYCIKAPHAARQSAPPTQPVYVEAVPRKAPPSP
jgi:hypothetical protein